jgi:hypothetical protein
MTNYEDIKSKTVDEMTEFLQDWAMKFLMGKSPLNVKEWLESEAEENESR